MNTYMRAIQPCNTDLYCIVVMSWHCALHHKLAIIFAITRVVNNYNIRTEPSCLNRTEPNSFRTESDFFFKNRTETEPILKNLFRTSLRYTNTGLKL